MSPLKPSPSCKMEKFKAVGLASLPRNRFVARSSQRRPHGCRRGNVLRAGSRSTETAEKRDASLEVEIDAQFDGSNNSNGFKYEDLLVEQNGADSAVSEGLLGEGSGSTANFGGIFDDFRIPFDYFTPLFVVGGVSAALGVAQSFMTSPDLTGFSQDALINFQLPVQSAIFLAVFLQAVAGWGFALAAIAGVNIFGPGVTIKDAQAFVALIAVVVDGGMFLPYRNTSFLDRSLVDRWVVGALVGTPLGVVALKYVDEKQALFVLGSMILGYCTYASYNIISCYHSGETGSELIEENGAKIDDKSCALPPDRYPTVATWGSGVFAGLLGGAFDAPGPPLVVFADLTGMANVSEMVKANLLAFFAVDSQLVAVSDLLDGRFQLPFIWPSVLLAIPTMYSANVLGKSVSKFVDQEKFRWVVIGLLTLCGLHQIGAVALNQVYRLSGILGRAFLHPPQSSHVGLCGRSRPRFFSVRAQLQQGEFQDAGQSVPIFQKWNTQQPPHESIPEGFRNDTDALKVFNARRDMCIDIWNHTRHTFRVAGVTFEDRQAILEEIAGRDMPVLFVPEPTNQFDPNAVRVTLLDGQTLGYVPREGTSAFPKTVGFGRIESVGQNSAGIYGAIVCAQPTIPSFTLSPFPKDREVIKAIMKFIPEKNLAKIEPYFETRCCFTGLSSKDILLDVCESWAFGADPHVLKLQGIEVMWEKLVPMKRESLDSITGSDLDALCLINRWRRSEAEMYIDYVKQQEDALSLGKGEEWTVDLTWLTERGIPDPLVIE